MPSSGSEPTRSTAAETFTALRPKLFCLAYRALGTTWAADDAVQETWMRMERAELAGIERLEAWLVTVTSRVCIDMIRQEVARREAPYVDAPEIEVGSGLSSQGPDPAEGALRNDDIALALSVVLDTLGPRERLALILHDVFALSFDDIAPIVEGTPTSARKLASRARARIRAVNVDEVRARRTSAVAAFLAAAREGDFGGLLQLLDPDIRLRSDVAAVEPSAAGASHGAPLLERKVDGADAVTRVFAGRAARTVAAVIAGARPRYTRNWGSSAASSCWVPGGSPGEY